MYCVYNRLTLLLVICIYLQLPQWCWACPSEVCICKWKGGKQSVECGGQQLTSIPEGMDPGTQVLNFSGNALQVLQSERFLRMDLLNLQKIYLSRNQLIRIHEKAFRGLSNLVELDLSDNALQQVPSETFQDYSSLMRLTLSGNPIRELKASAFRHLSFLTTLELSNCQIERVENEAFVGMDNLEWLRLDGNRIGFIQGAHILPKALHGISLHSNRWLCDCRLLDLHAWLNSYNTPLSEEPTCVEPARLKGQTIKTLKKDELACLPDVSPASTYTEISEGRNISIVCLVRAIPEPKVLWLFNGQVMSNDTFLDNLHMYYYIEESGSVEEKRSEIFIYNVGAEDNGTFSCVGTNVAGTSFSNYTLRVIIKEPPVVNEVSFPRDYMKYIIASSTGGGLLIFAILGTVVIKCSRRKSNKKRSKKYAMSTGGVGVTNVNGNGNNSGENGANDTGLMKCSSILNADGDSLNGGNALILGEGLTPTKLCKENGVIIGGQMKQNLLLYAPVGQYQQQTPTMDGLSLGGPGSLQMGASSTPPPPNSLLMSKSALAYCSPPGSVRNYQERNPDLVNDAAESVKHKTLKSVGSLEHDFDAVSDCSGPCSIQGVAITQTPVQYDNCYQIIRPTGLQNNLNGSTRFAAMATLPRGLHLKTVMSGLSANSATGPHQVDVHLNPVCYLGQDGMMTIDYNNAAAQHHAFLQQQQQHVLSPMQATTQQNHHQQQQQQQIQQQQQQQQIQHQQHQQSQQASQNFYRTLPHNRAHKQQQLTTATAPNSNMRYSLEAEFLQQRSNTQIYDKYMPNVRFTAEGYPQAQPQYPSPPEGYKTTTSNTVPVSSGSLDNIVPLAPTFQHWPPCLPGFQVQPIRYPSTIVGVLSPQLQQQQQQQQLHNAMPQTSTNSTISNQPLASTHHANATVIASGIDSISAAGNASITSSSTNELKKHCVAAQADSSTIPECDESEISPTNSMLSSDNKDEPTGLTIATDEVNAVKTCEQKQQSTTKLRHLNGPLADSPDEGYVGETQDNPDT